ncbi:MAG: proton-conducting transporter membrane subunit [Bacillota bacterium]
MSNILPLLAIFFPLAGALVIRFLKEEDAAWRHTSAFVSIFLTFAAVVLMLPITMRGEVIELRLIPLVENLHVYFRVDSMGMIFGMISSTLWVFAIVYSIGYMSHEHGQRNYFVFYVLSASATMGVAFAGNLFTLYIFYEYLAICTYPLVVHAQTREATRSGIKYISYSFGGGALIFLSMFAIYDLVGTLDFAPAGILGAAGPESRSLLIIVFVLCIAGFSTKAAVMPLHSWLPGAMVAPTPVSALLHAVAIVKAGVFGTTRVFYSLYGVETLRELNLTGYLAVIICFTIIAGSVMAIKQDVLKLRLAYSTIGQLGYITLGTLLLTPTGLAAGLLHIINHAFLKITLFFCAGIIITVTGKTKLQDLVGVGRRLPLTMIAFSIGAFGLMGMLPICGYISKYYLLTGSFAAGKPVFAYVVLGSTLLNSIYYLPIIVNAFFKKGSFEEPRGFEAPLTMLAPTVTLAGLAVILGLFANYTTIPLVEAVVNTVFR